MNEIKKKFNENDEEWDYGALAKIASIHGGPEKLIEKIYDDGYKDGYDDGYDDGYNDAMKMCAIICSGAYVTKTLAKVLWNKFKSNKEFEAAKQTKAKEYAENLLNEADKDPDVILDKDDNIITVDFSQPIRNETISM